MIHTIRVKRFTDHVTSNILDSHLTNNSNYYQVPSSQTDQYKHSYFVKTVIGWNHLADDAVDAPSCEAFQSRQSTSSSAHRSAVHLPTALTRVLVLQRNPAEAETTSEKLRL